jgi:cell division protein ZapA
MARVMLEVGGNSWPVNCREGEEAQVLALGRMIESRWAQAQRAAGDAGSARIMLLIALMLADELVDAQEKVRSVAAPAADDAALVDIADRLEKLAVALERGSPSD